MPSQTIPELFVNTVKNHPRPDMFSYRGEDGSFQDISSEEMLRRVHALRLALESLGITRSDHVAILAENRLEWVLSDLSSLCCGAINIPLYSTLDENDVAYILKDSEPKLIFVSTVEQARKIHNIRDQLPFLKDVISFDQTDLPNIMPLPRLLEVGENLAAKLPPGGDEICGDIDGGDVASILYTSGTTGAPKGVMLTHANFLHNVNCGLEVFPLHLAGKALSFLPLSHALERTCGYYAMMAAGVGISFAGGVDTVAADMLEVKPGTLICVPRLLEKIFDRVNTAAMSGSPIKRMIFIWAKKVVHDLRLTHLEKQEPSLWLRLQHSIVDKLVFSKLRARTGGALKFFVSGGAPLAPHINEFFNAANITAYEGYGLTETSPIISANLPGAQKVGSVGKPFPKTEVKIAEDGEILTRGPQVMKGYYKDPEATAAVFSEDGWLMTGDIGHLDEDGYLFITDRKKDLIVTAGGKNIAPQPIENLFKKNKFITNAVVIGDHRPYLISLFVPNFENLEKWAREHEIIWETHDDLEIHPAILDKFQKALDYVNEKLPQYSTVKKFALLRNEFTLESGELTPTLKVKRRVIQKKYHDVIEDIYTGV